MPRLFVAGACIGRLTSDVVDVRVYDYVEALLGVVVLGNICGSKLLRHDGCVLCIYGVNVRDVIEKGIPHYLTLHTYLFPRVPDMTSVQDPRTLYLLPRQVQ